MERYCITIDGGTTKTRICLWKYQKELIAVKEKPIGAKSCAVAGTTDIWKKGIREMLEEIYTEFKLSDSKIEAVIASGMLTSNLGICEIPHLEAPVPMETYYENFVKKAVPEVFEREILFIPGLKNSMKLLSDGRQWKEFDIMRGEETETYALLEKYGFGKNTICVLPGSHNKFVYVGKDGTAYGCKTTLSGELMDVITKETILSDSLQHGFLKADDYIWEKVREGYQIAKEEGVTRALFLIRLKDLFSGDNVAQLRSYLLGVILQSDVDLLQKQSFFAEQDDVRIIVTGDSVIGKAFYDLLLAEGINCELQKENDIRYPLAAFGAMSMYKRYAAR